MENIVGSIKLFELLPSKRLELEADVLLLDPESDPDINKDRICWKSASACVAVREVRLPAETLLPAGKADCTDIGSMFVSINPANLVTIKTT
jgi:hypothetical protein